MKKSISAERTAQKKMRQSNFELLRVISIVLIILYHLGTNVDKSDHGILITAFSSWGILGVNCFVAISCYFLSEQKFKFSRIAFIFVQMLTYGAAFFGIRLAYDYFTVGTPIISNAAKLLYKGFTAPLWVTSYWFVWTYILLCILSPFINLALSKSSQKNHALLIAVMSFVLLYGTLGNGTGIVVDLAFFLYVYVFVDYIKKYPQNKLVGFSTWASVIMAFVLIVSKAVLCKLGGVGEIISATVFNTGRHSAYMVIMSLFVFCAFKNMKIKQNGFVNFLANQSLGIYLFHENKLITLSVILFEFLEKKLSLSNFFIIIIGFAILFTAGTAIDFIKKEIIDKPILKLVNRLPFIKKTEEIMNLDGDI